MKRIENRKARSGEVGPRGGGRAARGLSLVEAVLVGAIVVVMAVPAIGLLVSSRQGIAASWNEMVARNLAIEALEWGATLPTDGLRGPIVVEEMPVETLKQAYLVEGASVLAPAFAQDTYRYPADMGRFFRRLEVTDASPEPQVPMLKLTVTVAWLEPSRGPDAVRSVRLWRMIGP